MKLFRGKYKKTINEVPDHYRLANKFLCQYEGYNDFFIDYFRFNTTVNYDVINYFYPKYELVSNMVNERNEIGLTYIHVENYDLRRHGGTHYITFDNYLILLDVYYGRDSAYKHLPIYK